MSDYLQFPIPTRRFPFGDILSSSDEVLVVNSLDQLAPYLSGGEYVLPGGKVVLILADLNIGANALRMSTGTVLRGLSGTLITSSATGGVLRASGLESACIVREINFLGTAGPVLNLSGPIDQQLNMFFCGLFGVDAGTVTGWEVQSMKDCFIQCAQGLRFAGTTRKLFISQCPFYGVATGNAAITLASDYSAAVADIVSPFFKFDDGTAINAEAGYHVGDGIFRGGLVDGTATPLSGLSPADVNWTMTDNLGVRDSRIAALAFLLDDTTTPITTVGAFVPVAGPFGLGVESVRFELNAGNDELVYIGRYPALIEVGAALSIDPSNNNRVAVRISKNGATVAETNQIIEQGAGPGASPRSVTALGLLDIAPGDRIGIAIANLDSTSDLPILSAVCRAIG